MTENAQQAPVRVPNVSPGAVSGLDHQVIGSAANDAYDAQQASPQETAELEMADVLAKGVDDLNDYLDGKDEAYVASVLEAEAAAERPRKGVLHGRHGTPEPTE